MADSGFQALEVDPETPSGGAIPFQFEVSWRSLTEPEIEPPKITGDTGTKPPEMAAPPSTPCYRTGLAASRDFLTAATSSSQMRLITASEE